MKIARFPISIITALLILVTLACGNSGKDSTGRIHIINILPTLTPTGVTSDIPAESGPVAVSNPTPLPADSNNPAPPNSVSPATPAPASVPGNTSPAGTVAENALPLPSPALAAPIEALPIATETPLPPTATPTVEVLDWSFTAVRTTYRTGGRNLVLFGDVLNNTGVTQELALIRADFYDDQGQLLADTQAKTIDYVPIDFIPSGGRLPFKITALNIGQISDFELNVEAQPSDQPLHQALEPFDISEVPKFGQHCLLGKIRNVGPPLQEYIVIMAILYDDQDQMLQFGEHRQSVAGLDLAGQPLPFEICLNFSSQGSPVRPEVRAWGQ